MRIILASKSPRRKEILETLGICFEIITADTDEHSDQTDPALLVEQLAMQKAQDVQDLLDAQDQLEPNTLIIASDTVVALNGEILGKPHDREDARRMISGLQNTTHHVLSGIAFCYIDAQGNRKGAYTHASTAVHFGPMSDADVELYVNSDEPYDKAGAYAIQGLAGRWITGIEGDYFNVVGLPVNIMCELAKNAFGIDLLRV
ncbi:MAG: septum formation protein Maf [Ruminococcaceae bacterium]|nr:septum formation protein Maf [Oscillospiraceae bacterium]